MSVFANKYFPQQTSINLAMFKTLSACFIVVSSITSNSGSPSLIVGISLAVTQADGYGDGP